MAFDKDEPDVPASNSEVQYTDPDKKVTVEPELQTAEPEAPTPDAAVEYGGK